MSPLMINIMLHYFCSTVDYVGNRSDGERENVADLVKMGMLRDVSNQSGCALLEITEKWKAYVDALLAVKEPVCRWEVSMFKESK